MAYPEHIEPGLWNISQELRRIVWYHEKLNDLGPIHTRTARIALGATPRLFDVILGVALRNRMLSMSGEKHIRVRVLGEESLAKAQLSLSGETKLQTLKKLEQRTLDQIIHTQNGDSGNSPTWPMATKSFYYQR